MAHRVLLVDDDPDLRVTVRRILEREGIDVTEAANGAEMKSRLSAGKPDLVILDLMLANENGLELAQEIRAESELPIVILSGKDDVIDRVVGLELGADDYITKPFHARELSARVRSVLRRATSKETAGASRAAETPEDIQIGAFLFEPHSGRLRPRDGVGEDVLLTGLESRTLAVLANRPNRVLSRDEIMDLLGERDWSPLDRSIDVVIGKIRKKLGDNSQEQKYFRTMRGVGYSFVSR